MTPLSRLAQPEIARLLERLAVKRYISHRPTECFHRRFKIWKRLLDRLPNAVPAWNPHIIVLSAVLDAVDPKPVPHSDAIITAIENNGGTYG